MMQKNRSQRTALLKYSFAVPLFALMLVLSSATVNNFQIPPPPQPPKPLNKQLPPPPQPPRSVDKKVPPPPEPPKPKNKNASKGKVYEVVEKLPTFPGGYDAFNTFLAKNIRYPAADRENNTQGKVIVQFTVELDGSLTDLRVVRAPSAAMGAEAVRVLGISPKWKPGIQNGKPVRSKFTHVVTFTLGEE